MTRHCARCVYDETVAGIAFDEAGICNYCHAHDRLDAEYPTGAEGQRRLDLIAHRIRADGRGKPYDVVVGVSGGCDSSYMLYIAKTLGLRPLAVHFDNTWNSTIAVRNIQRILKGLDVDLYTYVVDNEEYDDIYRSFMRAGVPDIEAPTDIGLATVLYMAAEKYGVRYIFEGHSFRTEGICPLGWSYMDGRYIAGIQRRFGTRPIRTYPNLSLLPFVRWMAFRGIKKIRPLYYMDYRKEEAKTLLSTKLGWEWYGGHHRENRFTAFYQGYFLPRRFGWDFRMLGYAALVRSGQFDRADALSQFETPQAGFDEDDLEMLKRRLGFTDEEFERLMNLPRRSFLDYPTYKRTFERLRPFFWLMYKLDRAPKSFYMKYALPDRLPAARPLVDNSRAALSPTFTEADRTKV